MDFVKRIMIPCIHKHKRIREMENIETKEHEELTVDIHRKIEGFTYITASIKRSGVKYTAKFMYDSFSRDENFKHDGELYSI